MSRYLNQGVARMLETTTQELIRQGIDRFWECLPSTWNQVRINLRATAAQDFDISFEQFTILRHIRRGLPGRIAGKLLKLNGRFQGGYITGIVIRLPKPFPMPMPACPR